MMRMTYIAPNGRIKFEGDVAGPKAAFETLADLTEVFEQEKCGLCEGTVLRCSIRKPKNAQGKPVKYFEIVCQSCGAILDVHQHAPPAETLYITRKDEDGNIKGKNGWYKWTPDGNARQLPQKRENDTPVKPLSGKPELDGYWKRWQEFFTKNHTLEDFNRFVRENLPLCPLDAKQKLWKDIVAFEPTWTFDKELKEFVWTGGDNSDAPF